MDDRELGSGSDGTGSADESRRWRRQRRPLGKLLLAGFVATSVMNLLMFLPRVGGWPETDIGWLLASVLPDGASGMLNANWWIGIAWHYLNGMVLFPLLFAVAFDPWLPGQRVVRGLLYSLLLWVLIEVLALPLLHAGIFATGLREPLKFSLVYLLGHVGYGLFLGGMAGAKDGLAARFDLARRATRRLRPALGL
jgi:hypothetical protein